MGVEIKGLRFPLAESGLSECAPSKQDPDVGVCAAIGYPHNGVFLPAS